MERQVAQLRIKKIASQGIMFCLLVNLTACQPKNQSQSTGANPPASQTDHRLSLENAILEQANPDGETVWKIQAQQAVYSQDRQAADLAQITANIFQDGKLILQVSGKRGRILEDGERFLLEEDVIATDPRNDTVLQAEQVEWQPQENLLILRQNLRGSTPKLKVAAQEARYLATDERLELDGDVVAKLKEPPLQLQSDYLVWEIAEERISSDRVAETASHRPLQIVRYRDNTVTDRVVANSAEVDLAGNTARLRANVELKSLDPSVTIATNEVTWNYEKRILLSSQPVQIVDSGNQIVVTGNRGQVDLATEVADLKDGVKGKSDRNDTQIYADELTWTIPTQTVEARGNVIYEQSDPQLNLTGVRAVGQLQNNNIVVSGSSSDRVVTKITP